jgi:hypothetical protein
MVFFSLVKRVKEKNKRREEKGGGQRERIDGK